MAVDHHHYTTPAVSNPTHHIPSGMAGSGSARPPDTASIPFVLTVRWESSRLRWCSAPGSSRRCRDGNGIDTGPMASIHFRPSRVDGVGVSRGITERTTQVDDWCGGGVFSDDPSDEIRGEPWLSAHPAPASGDANNRVAQQKPSMSLSVEGRFGSAGFRASPSRDGLGK
jgi:hypothetical protein